MKKLLVFTALTALVGACAPRPDAIAPISMPDSMYSGMSCERAKQEYSKTANTLGALEKKQNDAATGDAVGVFLLGVPASSLTGGDKSGQIATEKGKKIALEARLARC